MRFPNQPGQRGYWIPCSYSLFWPSHQNRRPGCPNTPPLHEFQEYHLALLAIALPAFARMAPLAKCRDGFRLVQFGISQIDPESVYRVARLNAGGDLGYLPIKGGQLYRVGMRRAFDMPYCGAPESDQDKTDCNANKCSAKIAHG